MKEQQEVLQKPSERGLFCVLAGKWSTPLMERQAKSFQSQFLLKTAMMLHLFGSHIHGVTTWSDIHGVTTRFFARRIYSFSYQLHLTDFCFKGNQTGCALDGTLSWSNLLAANGDVSITLVITLSWSFVSPDICTLCIWLWLRLKKKPVERLMRSWTFRARASKDWSAYITNTHCLSLRSKFVRILTNLNITKACCAIVQWGIKINKWRNGKET